MTAERPTKPAAVDSIKALPILLLVLGALSAGIGLWGLVREPVSLLTMIVGTMVAVLLFVAVVLAGKLVCPPLQNKQQDVKESGSLINVTNSKYK